MNLPDYPTMTDEERRIISDVTEPARRRRPLAERFGAYAYAQPADAPLCELREPGRAPGGRPRRRMHEAERAARNLVLSMSTSPLRWHDLRGERTP